MLNTAHMAMTFKRCCQALPQYRRHEVYMNGAILCHPITVQTLNLHCRTRRTILHGTRCIYDGTVWLRSDILQRSSSRHRSCRTLQNTRNAICSIIHCSTLCNSNGKSFNIWHRNNRRFGYYSHLISYYANLLAQSKQQWTNLKSNLKKTNQIS